MPLFHKLHFLEWQPCHSPVMVFCLFRAIHLGLSKWFFKCTGIYASFPIPFFNFLFLFMGDDQAFSFKKLCNVCHQFLHLWWVILTELRRPIGRPNALVEIFSFASVKLITPWNLLSFIPNHKYCATIPSLYYE